MAEYIVVVNKETDTITETPGPTIITSIPVPPQIIKDVDSSVTVLTEYIGPPGPEGPAGPAGDEEVMYSARVDFINDNLLYRGEAVPGSAEGSAVWRIRKITISAVDDDVVQLWADGTDAFTKVWNNRLGYSYS